MVHRAAVTTRVHVGIRCSSRSIQTLVGIKPRISGFCSEFSTPVLQAVEGGKIYIALVENTICIVCMTLWTLKFEHKLFLQITSRLYL